MKLFVFKCRDNDHKNDNVKINQNDRQKKRPPGGSRNEVRVFLCRMQRKRLFRPTGWFCSYEAHQAIVILLSR
ncbi:hypothetical protein BE964_06250 [Escherichia coli]|nr:hypothetical protein BE964_06250 [Escherichia coli]HAJ7332269.1 hypothetical protein [Escherichia coli UCI 52]AQV48422.1 hypothetical protein BE966_23075 [Escherichia coli]AQV55334.1 hypothetical protein BE941_02165 [Escherichia coli]AQV62320.1 hypothetical protein BE928_10805 [Escherichia coli]